eukprot:TRINITY_DN60098_c0_g1_i5.p1 TRINITY_DN60098_c0_g1~~TRINITY_DN60098_c0_g1_i5.p1  ORF type:complete len:239 (+),score=57.28 TRINITY_DN60098_c0_g1_i5:138-854(+)
MIAAVLCLGTLLLGAHFSAAHESSGANNARQSLLSLITNQAVQLHDLKSQLQQQDSRLQQQDKQLQQQDKKLQQQSSQMQLQGDKVSKLERETTSIKADVDRNNQQVAFSVRYSGTKRNLNVGTQGTLKYPNIITNVGNGYDPLTGHFTAPYAGTYAFYATLRSTNDHGWILLGIVKGRQVLIQFTGNGNVEHWDRGSGLVTTHLQKGEQVYVRQTGGGTYLESGFLTNFSGMLLAAD